MCTCGGEKKNIDFSISSLMNSSFSICYIYTQKVSGVYIEVVWSTEKGERNSKGEKCFQPISLFVYIVKLPIKSHKRQ